jgi:hypothetical protein
MENENQAGEEWKKGSDDKSLIDPDFWKKDKGKKPDDSGGPEGEKA